MNQKILALDPSVDLPSGRLCLCLPKDLPRAVIQICSDPLRQNPPLLELIECLTGNGILVCYPEKNADSSSAEEERSVSALLAEQTASYAAVRKIYRHLPYLLLGVGFGANLGKALLTEDKAAFDGVILVGGGVCPETALRGSVKDRLKTAFAGKEKKAAVLKDRFCRAYGLASGVALSNRSSDFYRQCLELLQKVGAEDWYAEVPKATPMLLLSGETDPTADGGGAMASLYETLQDAELCLLEQKNYAAEQNPLESPLRETVWADLLEFSNRVIDGVCAARTANFSQSGFTAADSDQV